MDVLQQTAPVTFDNLEKEGFQMDNISKEQKINAEMVKLGRSLLDIARHLKDQIYAVKNTSDFNAVMPALNSRIECDQARINDYKRRLSNSFNVTIS